VRDFKEKEQEKLQAASHKLQVLGKPLFNTLIINKKAICQWQIAFLLVACGLQLVA
jgi:hypothetical protein